MAKTLTRFFDGETNWPVSVHYCDQGEATYSMDPPIAEWWFDAGPVVDMPRMEQTVQAVTRP